VHNGLFRYVLDLSSIDDWTAGQELYLEVIVDGETLTPREELYSYPYAINSHLLEGKTTDYFLNTSVETQKKDGGLNIIGNVGIGTTAPTQKLDVAGNVKIRGRLAPTTLWPGFSLISPSDYWSGWQSNDKRWITGVTRAQADTGANVWDIEVYDDSSWQHMMELRGDGSAFFRGNVGIGTMSPGAKLEVAGNFRATGGIEPDWDSGWVYVDRSNKGLKTLTHNLNYFPRQIQWWFSTSNPGSWVGPVAWSKQDYWSNPLGVWITKTQIKFTIWDRLVYRMYNGSSSSWLNYNSGYYRILFWK